jgi:hypothetical protein
MMEMMFESFATPLFLMPVYIKEYCTGSGNFCSHEARYDEKKAESIAIGEQRWLKL